MMGVKPAQAITEIAAMGVRLIGANCGRGTDEMRIIASELADAKPADVHVFIQSNAGLPQLVGADFVYTGTPAEMGEFALEMKALGINAIGSCCGSTHEHTAAIAGALKS
jgi:methionine synthase I (cobalamin-dependent)